MYTMDTNDPFIDSSNWASFEGDDEHTPTPLSRRFAKASVYMYDTKSENSNTVARLKELGLVDGDKVDFIAMHGMMASLVEVGEVSEGDDEVDRTGFSPILKGERGLKSDGGYGGDELDGARYGDGYAKLQKLGMGTDYSRYQSTYKMLGVFEEEQTPRVSSSSKSDSSSNLSSSLTGFDGASDMKSSTSDMKSSTPPLFPGTKDDSSPRADKLGVETDYSRYQSTNKTPGIFEDEQTPRVSFSFNSKSSRNLSSSFAGFDSASDMKSSRPCLFPGATDDSFPRAQKLSMGTDYSRYQSVNKRPGIFEEGYQSTNKRPSIFEEGYQSTNKRPSIFEEGYQSTYKRPGIFEEGYQSTYKRPGIFEEGYQSTYKRPGIFEDKQTPRVFDSGSSRTLSSPFAGFDRASNMKSSRPYLFPGTKDDSFPRAQKLSIETDYSRYQSANKRPGIFEEGYQSTNKTPDIFEDEQTPLNIFEDKQTPLNIFEDKQTPRVFDSESSRNLSSPFAGFDSASNMKSSRLHSFPGTEDDSFPGTEDDSFPRAPPTSFPSPFPTPLGLPLRHPNQNNVLRELDDVYAREEHPIIDGKMMSGSISEDGDKSCRVKQILENHITAREPYVRLASDRLQAIMGTRNDLPFELPKSQPKTPSLEKPNVFMQAILAPTLKHIADDVSRSGMIPSPLKIKTGTLKLIEDSAELEVETPNNELAKVPKSFPGVDPESGAGLREYMLQMGKRYGMRRRECRSISFHDITPDLRTNTPTNKLLGEKQLTKEDGFRLDIYEVDLPSTYTDPYTGATTPTSETWIWFLISHSLIDLISSPQPPPDYPFPNPTSWMVFALPLINCIKYPEFIETNPKSEYYISSNLSISERASHHRTDFDLSFSGIPIFEFSAKPAAVMKHWGDWIKIHPEEDLSSILFAGAAGKFLNAGPILDSMFESGEYGNKEWWIAFYDLIAEDCVFWTDIRAAMGRGKCRIVVRWLDREEEFEGDVETDKQNLIGLGIDTSVSTSSSEKERNSGLLARRFGRAQKKESSAALLKASKMVIGHGRAAVPLKAGKAVVAKTSAGQKMRRRKK